jgi:hypothetical protein
MRDREPWRDTVLAFVYPLLALAGIVVGLAVLHWALGELGWWPW